MALTLFVLPFSFAIAVLKDVPDAEGDRRFRIATFTVRLGPERRIPDGHGRAGGRLPRHGGGRAAAGGRRLAVAARAGAPGLPGRAAARSPLRVDPGDPAGFTRFYMRVWALFFVEYLLVPAAVLAGPG